MNPAYQVNLPPGYPPNGLPAHTSSVPLPGVMPPLAYTHGLYSPVSPTLTAPGSLSANGPGAASGGLLYESNASPLMRPYGKGSPYVVPATHASYPTGLNSSPAHTQSAYSHSLSQQTSGGTLYSAQSAYPPGLIPGLAPPANLLQAQQQHQQQRQLYLQSGSQAAMNPALGLNPAALGARPSPVHAIPVNPGQNYQYAMMAAPPAGTIYPTSPTYYPSYTPVYQNNGVIQ
ncbi:calcium-binding protein P-like isoform X2 [Lytechinus pictus]|uniref:calcium-binding protein P-like isoform X2 n=1 Tax=Lytechinus pictus TaxID=7653 RepID=UPI00240D8A9A|nr:calcium-binding protein P-like isoform X2 [Lytechinus pictus]